MPERSFSELIRDSWNTKRFWFNYAAREPLDVDDLFYTYLNIDGAGFESLHSEERAGLELFVQMKMEQLAEYKRDHAKYVQAKG
jgi:hypothetical protein